MIECILLLNDKDKLWLWLTILTSYSTAFSPTNFYTSSNQFKCRIFLYAMLSDVLQPVNIYVTNDVFRISIDNIPSTLMSTGRVKLATLDSVQCPLKNCMFELATNQKDIDCVC